MALQPINMSEDVFVKEVDEELQKDQLLSLWQRFGKPVLAGIAAILLAWAGWLFWQDRQAQAHGLEGEKLTQIADTLAGGDNTTVVAELRKIIASDAKGFHSPAQMILGGIEQQKNNASAAAKTFGLVVADSEAPQVWRDLALIRQTAAEFDAIKPDVAIARLRPLAVSGKPWFGSAGEMIAIAYIRMNRPKEAGKMFADIAKDEKVPETIRNRSSEMANALGVASARPEVKEGVQ